jgi:hypothetical protein
VQNGVPALFAQSAFVAHTAQRPWLSHAGVAGVALQSAAVRHWTHSEACRLQCGVWLPVHCASLVQPALQRSSSGSQIGCVAGQSEFEKHWTHFPLPAKQCGAVAGQSVFAAHCTQSWVVELQIGEPAGQSLGLWPGRQPTHAPKLALPLVASQSGVSPPHPVPPPPLAVHAARQVWSFG